MASKNPTGNAASRGRISDAIPFKDVTKLMEKISVYDSNDKKKKELQKFLEYYRKTFLKVHGTLDSDMAGGDSMYPIFRILLPGVDRGRRAYGFKSSVLGRMFAQILGLDKKSKDGRRLIEFKDPDKAGSLAGDIGGIIFSVLKERFSSNEESKDGPSLSDIHDALDELAKSDVNQDGQKKILQKVVRKLTAVEGKWLVRILLKDNRLGISKTVIYSLLHSEAKALSERIGDLELLCQKLNDPKTEVSDLDISLFHHFCPMLATRMEMIDSTYEPGGSINDSDVTGAPSRSSKSDVVTLPPPPFYVEIKWDGERFQIHYDGTDFKYFSRRAFNFTAKFDETLTPRLRPKISASVQSFILDGEMMAYNKKYKLFTQKGYNIDVKTINKDNPNHCPVFVAFDLVYYNGNILTNTPLSERRKKLATVFTPQDDIIRLSKSKTMNSKEEVIEALNCAIDDGEEGLIVKDMNSVYQPGKRGLAWLKIKPEFLADNSVDDLDLVILGAYYTESTRRGGELTHFLIGLIDKSKGKEEYYPIAKVGSGRLRSMDVKDLIIELKPKFVKTTFSNVHLRARKNPDFLINPADSIVVQVKASEIIPSDVYSISHTLRFPRIVKIRRDKSPRDIMTVQEFKRLNESCKGKLAKRTDGAKGKPYSFSRKRLNPDGSDDERDEQPQLKKSPNPDASVKQSNKDGEDEGDEPLPGPSLKLLTLRPRNFTKSPTKINSPSKSGLVKSPLKGNAAIQNDIFTSKVFCVYGASSWKSEMESKIRKHGGGITQNPVKDLFAIVGERKTSVLVEKAIRAGVYDVIEPAWILRSIERKMEIPLVPSYFWSITKKTGKQFQAEYDKYGDSYTKKNTLQETRQLLERVMQMSNVTKSPTKSNQNSNDSETDDETNSSDDEAFLEAELTQELFDSENNKSTVTWSFMRDVKIAFRGPADLLLSETFQFYGGKVAPSENEEGVTHVVVSSEGPSSKKDHSRALVVTQKWLEDCLARKEEVDERRYSAL